MSAGRRTPRTGASCSVEAAWWDLYRAANRTYDPMASTGTFLNEARTTTEATMVKLEGRLKGGTATKRGG